MVKFSKKITSLGIRLDLIQYFLKAVQFMLMCDMLKAHTVWNLFKCVVEEITFRIIVVFI